LLDRRQEALDQVERIRVLDPVSSGFRAIEAAVYYFTRDYDRTIATAQAVLAGEPNFHLMYYWMGRAYDSQGRLSGAIPALEKWHDSPGKLKGRGFGMLGSAYARAGRRTDAKRLLDTAIARSRTTYVAPSSVALIYLGLADLDRGFEWLEKAYLERDHSLAALKADPAYDAVRDHPRFVALLRRMRLE
jgi:tetratricopeptide (TPR) repeat protein